MSRQKTTKAGREILKAVEPIIAAAGAHAWIEDAQGTGHQRLIVELNGQTRFSPIAGSPRSLDVANKAKISDVKRMLREMTN